MDINTNSAKKELKAAANRTEKVYRQAKKHFPTMRKEITVKTQYFSKQGSKHPCAETFFKLCIDCNLLKALIIMLILMMSVCIYRAMHCKKNKKHCQDN